MTLGAIALSPSDARSARGVRQPAKAGAKSTEPSGRTWARARSCPLIADPSSPAAIGVADDGSSNLGAAAAIPVAHEEFLSVDSGSGRLQAIRRGLDKGFVQLVALVWDIGTALLDGCLEERSAAGGRFHDEVRPGDEIGEQGHHLPGEARRVLEVSEYLALHHSASMSSTCPASVMARWYWSRGYRALAMVR